MVVVTPTPSEFCSDVEAPGSDSTNVEVHDVDSGTGVVVLEAAAEAVWALPVFAVVCGATVADGFALLTLLCAASALDIAAGGIG